MSRTPITQEILDRATTIRPYFRTVRQLLSGSYVENGFSAYIRDPQYAPGGQDDIRSFLIVQQQFIEILEYIEPATANNQTYSLRLRNLLMLICTEVESNLKAILAANSYVREDGKPWNMVDYRKVNQSHFLSDYKIYLPYWDGDNERQPFKSWETSGKILAWYQAYNNTKHARGTSLSEANLENVVDAMAGLVALISAQFYNIDFVGQDYMVAENGLTNLEYAIGGYFTVLFPDEMPIEERYHLGIEYTQNKKHIFNEFKYK